MSALEIEEGFDVPAPAADVFAFLLDPQQLVGCMPGAALDEVVNDRVFEGNVKVKVGTVTLGYRGKIELTRVDEAEHVLEAEGEGREKGGAGKVAVGLSVQVEPTSEQTSRVRVNANVKLAGKIVRFGRGLIDAVSKELFQEFAKAVAERVPRPEAPTAAAATAEAATTTAKAEPATPIRALPLLWRSLRSWLRSLFRGRH